MSAGSPGLLRKPYASLTLTTTPVWRAAAMLTLRKNMAASIDGAVAAFAREWPGLDAEGLRAAVQAAQQAAQTPGGGTAQTETWMTVAGWCAALAGQPRLTESGTLTRAVLVLRLVRNMAAGGPAAQDACWFVRFPCHACMSRLSAS
jgi:hypothetical protein